MSDHDAMPRDVRFWILAFAVALVACRRSPTVVAEHGLFETTSKVPVHATFAHDANAVQVGSFPRGDEFVVRFAPPEPGRWTWSLRADGSARELSRGEIVSVARPHDHGYVRVDGHDPHRLAFDDGKPFWVLGENRINVYDPSWNDGGLSIEDYVARMASSGMTTLRVFVFDDCHSETTADGHQPGCLEPSVGHFDEREAAMFDRIFAAAEKNDVYVVLVPFALGLSPAPDTWKSWRDNPYRVLADGPQAFFTSPAARAAASRKLRYVVDRWGYSEHLLAIDLLNEPEWDGVIPESTWMPWAEEMARVVRAADPYGHLVTVGSVGTSWNVGADDETTWWRSPRESLIQWHLYGRPFYEPHALAAEMTRRVEQAWAFDKPVVCGEFAYGGEDKSTYEHTHAGIWSALMSGAGALAHSAPPFQIDSDEPMTNARAAHFHTLAGFLHAMDNWGDVMPRTDVTTSRSSVRAWSLRAADGRRRALWLLGDERNEGVTASVRDLPPGVYRVAWIDDVTGASLATTTVTATTGEPTTIAAPEFTRHVAALVTPFEPRAS